MCSLQVNLILSTVAISAALCWACGAIEYLPSYNSAAPFAQRHSNVCNCSDSYLDNIKHYSNTPNSSELYSTGARDCSDRRQCSNAHFGNTQKSSNLCPIPEPRYYEPLGKNNVYCSSDYSNAGYCDALQSFASAHSSSKSETNDMGMLELPATANAKKALAKLLERAPHPRQTHFTSDSYLNYEQAYKYAKQIHNETDASEHTIIDSINKLENATKELTIAGFVPDTIEHALICSGLCCLIAFLALCTCTTAIIRTRKRYAKTKKHQNFRDVP